MLYCTKVTVTLWMCLNLLFDWHWFFFFLSFCLVLVFAHINWMTMQLRWTMSCEQLHHIIFHLCTSGAPFLLPPTPPLLSIHLLPISCLNVHPRKSQLCSSACRAPRFQLWKEDWNGNAKGEKEQITLLECMCCLLAGPPAEREKKEHGWVVDGGLTEENVGSGVRQQQSEETVNLGKKWGRAGWVEK